MRGWRYPFGEPPEAVFIVLGADASSGGTDSLLTWLETALPLLNWRSHLFVVGGSEGAAERFSHGLLDLAGAFLRRHGFANLYIHPLVHVRAGDKSQVHAWDRLIAAIKPFQQQARELSSEARLHVAPILAPLPGVSPAEASRAAEFFRSRMAIPSFHIQPCTLEELVNRAGSESARFFVDSDSLGLPALLWKSHVFETILDRIEEEREPLIGLCRTHLVLDAKQGRVFFCFSSWEQGAPGVDLAEPNDGPPTLPAPPNGASCLRCIADAALSIRENLEANKRETEGRRAYFKLSLELAGRGELDLAADLARLAFELSVSNEDKVAALIHEALCLRDSGLLEKADKVLALASEFTQDKGQIAYHRGRVQFVWRDYIEALDWFEDALKSGSSQIPMEDMCFEMALCHINIEEYPEARRYLDRSQKPGEQKAPVAFYRGVCDYGEGKIEAALTLFRVAQALGPAAEDLGRVLFYIGACLKETEQYEKAAAVLRDAVAADPEDLANHNLLGFCYYKLKRHEDAVACFLRAVEIDPSSGIDWANLASNLRDLGKPKEAIAMYKKALSLDPSIGFARDNLTKLSG